MKYYACVVTALKKDKDVDELIVKSTYQYHTGFHDPKDLILYKKLGSTNNGISNVDFELWKGDKYGDRLGFDTSKQIGESYAEIFHYDRLDVIYVHELYEIEK